MQREKSVKIKEVIASLCKVLSALGVDSIPGADTFRRAKFNKTDVVEELWKFLHDLLMKAVVLECSCQSSPHSDLDAQSMFVRGALWHCGYGAQWVVGPQAGSCHRDPVGSRELLLAFGWVLSSGNLLEVLLGERALQLEVLSVPHRVPLCSPRGEEPSDDGAGESDRGAVQWDGDLKTLQWQYGKLRFQWRSLLAVQEERAGLAHKILSHISSPSISPPSVTGSHHTPSSTGISKEVERLRTLNGMLEAYLDWKLLEPVFWSWMDSVIDSKLSDPSEEHAADMQLRERPVNQSCSHGDEGRRAVKQLDEVLLRLQAELRARRAVQSRCTITTQYARVASNPEEVEAEQRVAARLQGLALAYTPTTASRGFRPCLQEPSKPTPKPPRGEGSQAGLPGQLQVSEVLRELRGREAFLQGELGRLKQGHREELQERASALEGLVLIPPLKR